jgi:LuxR family maltose regulon positive regulatory protein
VAAGDPLIRRDLVDRVLDGLDRGHVVLEAGAGYGKTTLVAQALRRRSGPVAWLGCRSDNTAPGQFVLELAAAIERAAPGTLARPAEDLRRGTGVIDAREALRVVLDEIDALTAPDGLVLVLDDVEALPDDEATRALLTLLLDGDGALRIVLATRRLPAITLARHELSGRILRLTAADLALTAAECALATGLDPLDPHQAALADGVYTATEGWPMGVAVLARRGVETAADLAPDFETYFADEALADLPSDIVDALTVCAIAPKIDQGVLRAFAVPPGTAERLLALTPFARRTRAGDLVLHPLFRDALLSRRAQLDADRRREGHRAFAGVLAERGDEAGALVQLVGADEHESAASLLPRVAPILLRTSPASLARALDVLGATAGHRPELAEVRSLVAWGDGVYEDAAALARSALDGYRGRADVAGEWRARFRLADTAYTLGRLDEVPSLAEGFTAVPAECSSAAVETAVLAASAQAQLGRSQDAVRMAERIVVSPGGARWASMFPAWEGFFIGLPQGRLDDALRAGRDAAARLSEDDPHSRLPYVLGALATVHEARGEHDDLARAMDAAEDAARAAGIDGHVGALIRLHRAGMRARLGAFDEAEAMLGALDVRHGWYAYDEFITRGTVALGRGDPATCGDAAQEALRIAGRGPLTVEMRAALLTAPLLLASGRPDLALTTIGQMLERLPQDWSPAPLLLMRGWLGAVAGAATAGDDLAAGLRAAGKRAGLVVRAGGRLLEPVLVGALREGTVPAGLALPALLRARPESDVHVVLAQDPDPSLRASVVETLATGGSPAEAQALTELTEDEDATVAGAARAAVARLATTPPPLHISVLGGFAVRRGRHVVTAEEWGRPLARKVARFLVTRRGELVPEDELFEHFWPAKSPESARRNLHVAISSVRAVLDAPGWGASRIAATDHAYRFTLLPGDELDGDRFDRAAAAALAAPTDVAGLRAAAAMWTGDPLPEDLHEEWALVWRERLRDRYAAVLGALADGLLAAGDTAAATDVARRLVALDPCDEAAHRRLIRAFAASGRRGRALRQFLECRRTLVTELGVEPAAATAALHADVLAGRLAR